MVSFFLTLFAISAWLTGKKERALISVFQPDRWDPSKLALVVTAIAVGGVASNLLAAMIADVGWTETLGRHRMRAGLYTALIVTCAIITTIIVAR
jgi:hypothetical protein